MIERSLCASVSFPAYSIFSAKLSNIFSLLYLENEPEKGCTSFPDSIESKTKLYIYKL